MNMNETIIKTEELLKVLNYMNMLNLKGMLYTPAPIMDFTSNPEIFDRDDCVFTLEEIINQLKTEPSDLIKELQEKVEKLEAENYELVRKNNALLCSLVLMNS